MSSGDSGAQEPAAPEAPEPEAAAEPAAPVDELRQDLVRRLREALGDTVVDAVVEAGDVWVRVQPSGWRRAAEVCKAELGMEYFCFLSGIDWMPNPDLSGEKLWDPGAVDDDVKSVVITDSGRRFETGKAGGEARFQVLARVYNPATFVGITLKTDLDEERPEVDSWVPVYRGADWHERETWEMFGFDFVGHPSLRHIYLPTEFEGFPLRKDFPLLSREVKPWPGLVDKEPIPGEEEEESAEAAAGGEQ